MTTFVEKIERSNDRPSDPRNQEVVHAVGDPQVGNFATPINASPLTKLLINNLPIYRQGLSPVRRGLEVGLVHGYWLVGPFASFNPLRDTSSGLTVALLSALGLVFISTVLIVLYAASQPPAPLATITTPRPPQLFQYPSAWNHYAQGFCIGGVAGAGLAFILLDNLDAFKQLF